MTEVVLLFDEDAQGHSEPLLIPHRELSQAALRGVVESFVLREGTDYGVREFSLEEKIAQVMGQLEREEARIVFDPKTESVDIVQDGSRSTRGKPDGV